MNTNNEARPTAVAGAVAVAASASQVVPFDIEAPPPQPIVAVAGAAAEDPEVAEQDPEVVTDANQNADNSDNDNDNEGEDDENAEEDEEEDEDAAAATPDDDELSRDPRDLTCFGRAFVWLDSFCNPYMLCSFMGTRYILCDRKAAWGLNSIIFMFIPCLILIPVIVTSVLNQEMTERFELSQRTTFQIVDITNQPAYKNEDSPSGLLLNLYGAEGLKCINVRYTDCNGAVSCTDVFNTYKSEKTIQGYTDNSPAGLSKRYCRRIWFDKDYVSRLYERDIVTYILLFVTVAAMASVSISHIVFMFVHTPDDNYCGYRKCRRMMERRVRV